MEKSSRAQDLVESATLNFAIGEIEAALNELDQACDLAPDLFAIHHARAEILFSERRFDEALESAEKAILLSPDDIHIHTTLSRIWMERGNKEKAEHYGAQARMLGWKEELKQPPPSSI